MVKVEWSPTTSRLINMIQNKGEEVLDGNDIEKKLLHAMASLRKEKN